MTIAGDKLKKLQNLSDAIQRAQRAVEASASHYNACALQHLINQRNELLATMRPTLVSK